MNDNGKTVTRSVLAEVEVGRRGYVTLEDEGGHFFHTHRGVQE